MIDEKRIDAIFNEMAGYTIELASDPNSLGPQYFQDKIALCRNYLNAVSLVQNELGREKLTYSSELRVLETQYQLDYDQTLATDQTVKGLANIEDRKSTVAYMLRLKQKRIHELKDALHSLDAVSKVVGFRSRELHATMNAIRDQKRLMQTEIHTGAFYGDERVPKAKTHSKPEGDLGIDDDELSALLSGAASMPDDASEEAPKAEPPVVVESPKVAAPAPQAPAESTGETSDEAAIMSFLGATDELPKTATDEPSSSVSKEESEIADLLATL